MTSFWQKTRFGLLLLAWLMQLMVFLTPLFSDDVSPGHGVCIELAAVVEGVAPPAPSMQSMPPSDHQHLHMHNAAMHAEQKIVLDQSSSQDHSQHVMAHVPSPQLATHAESHAQDHAQGQGAEHGGSVHAQCGFCLLLGHSVLPPLVKATVSDLRFAFAQYRLHARTDQVLRVFGQRYFKPPSQAPPLF